MLKLYIPCDSVARAVGADQVADALLHEAERRQLPLDIQRTSSRGFTGWSR
jgi:formate dehydrogenase iron-sulfur subunit